MTLATAVSAASWEFTTQIDLGAIYTDNLRLQPEGQEEDEVIFTVAPTFTATTEGDRLEADIRYRPEAYFYNTAPEADRVFHVLDATMTATLVRDAIFLVANGTNTQSIVSPDLNIPSTNVSIVGNRLDSRVLEVRPRWDQDLGGARVLAEVAYIDTRHDEFDDTTLSGIQDSQQRNSIFQLNNHANQQGVAWGLDYQYRRTDYEASTPWDYQRAGVNLGYWFGGTFRLFGSYGAETAFDNFFEPDLDDEFWEAGFQYRPNQRLDIELAGGVRSFGDSYRARFTYRLRRGQTSLTYTERPTTVGEIFSGRRPIRNTDNLDGFLNRPDGTDRFIQRRGDWRTTLNFAKSEFSLRLFYENRDERTSASGEPLSPETFSGVAFRFGWQLGSKSTFGLGADYTDRETSSTDAGFLTVSLDYTYQISQIFSVAIVAQQANENNRDFPASDYVENQVQVVFSAFFR